MKEYIDIGKIVSTQGLKGEARAEAWCDEASFVAQLKKVRVGKVDNVVRVEYGRVQKNVVILKLEGVDDVEAASLLRGQVLYVHRSEIPLKRGEYLIQDLIGCAVFDADSGERYGEVSDISHTGANDVWHIRFADGTQKLIPYIPQVVLDVDITAGRVVIRPLKGLFD